MAANRRVMTAPTRKGKLEEEGPEAREPKAEEVPAEKAYDTYIDKVVKYIPAEIVAAWLFISGLIAASTSAQSSTLNWLVFVGLLIITPIYLWRETQVKKQPPATTQIVVSTVAFAVWIFAIGGPFKLLQYQDKTWYDPLYGAIILVFFTLISGLIPQPVKD